MPALCSVTVIEPDTASDPVHPSPVLPPEAVQAAAFFELHTNETPVPTVSVESALDRVTLGVATLTDVAGTAM